MCEQQLTKANPASGECIVKIINFFFFLNIFWGFCVYCVPLPPLRGQHMVLCHPRWLPTSGLTEFAMCWEELDLNSGLLICSQVRYH